MSAVSHPTAADLLLDALVELAAGDLRVAVPLVGRAIEALRDGGQRRWLALASFAAIEIWDDEGLHDIRSQLRLSQPVVTGDGAMLELDQMSELDDILAGRFWTVTAPLRGLQLGRDVPPEAQIAPQVTPGELLALAWCGQSTVTRASADACMREAFARGQGLYVALAHHATAILEIGLGRYEAALTAAKEACEEPGLYVITSTLPDLVEAAVRSGARDAAVSAVGRLAERARPCGRDWGLGILARSRALLEDGSKAETLYEESIDRLRRSRAAPQLARAHLLYGEWLRRERRRREAREQLTTARDMFVFMGAQAFAERARTELAATGERASRRLADGPVEELTNQEARIAELVREGASNAEIATKLYISPRTVEYHLHKVFRKLGVSSRTQLALVVVEAGDPGAPPD